MPVHYEDIRSDLETFGEWLDDVMPNERSYNPASRFNNCQQCVARFYTSPDVVFPRHDVRKRPAGEQVSAISLRLSLALHEPACRVLSIAGLKRVSETAVISPGTDLIQGVQDEHKIDIERSSSGLLPVQIRDVVSVGRLDQTGGGYVRKEAIEEKVSFPDTVDSVRLTLDAMRFEIQTALAFNRSIQTPR